MKKSPGGIWFKYVTLKPRIYQYKYVVLDEASNFTWYPDPFVKEKDKDENSIFDFSRIIILSEERFLVKGRKLDPLDLKKGTRNRSGARIQKIIVEKVWLKPGQTNSLILTLADLKKIKNPSLLINIKQMDKTLFSTNISKVKPLQTVSVMAPEEEGGYLIECFLKDTNKIIDRDIHVLSVANRISDDLRYGFYANWDRTGKNYDKKTQMFADLYINAIEYYDYFPAHGNYAPTEDVYQFEPFFGKNILTGDIQDKIKAARKRNILSLAYIAAYAASESIYKKYPYAMTDGNGIPLIFNGSVMTEQQAREQGKPVWFYLMAIAGDSRWYPVIMKELKRTLDDSPDDLVSFDGFEIDSYGHSEDDRYYSEKSRYNGELLSLVLKKYVGGVRQLTHSMKPSGLVSFNCVNEYGMKNIYDVVDFIFVENWSGYKNGLDDLIDICYENRGKKNKRVILKVYPADTKPGSKSFDPKSTSYILGAAMTGGGSVMVAGEPDEEKPQMHALNTLYYPDNVVMSSENRTILQNYYFFDALLYGIKHGPQVSNIKTEITIPGCTVRGFNSDKNFLIFSFLHHGMNYQWDIPIKQPEELKNYEIAFKLPFKRKVMDVYYGSPDYQELLIPQKLDFEIKGRHVRTLLPRLKVYGVLLIRYR